MESTGVDRRRHGFWRVAATPLQSPRGGGAVSPVCRTPSWVVASASPAPRRSMVYLFGTEIPLPDRMPSRTLASGRDGWSGRTKTGQYECEMAVGAEGNREEKSG